MPIFDNIIEIIMVIIGLTVLLFIGVYVLPMLSIISSESDEFCQDKGFDHYNPNLHGCLDNTETIISDKDVNCKWGFYKTSCQYQKQLKVVEVND